MVKFVLVMSRPRGVRLKHVYCLPRERTYLSKTVRLQSPLDLNKAGNGGGAGDYFTERGHY